MEKLAKKWAYLQGAENIIRICVVATQGSAPRHKDSAMILRITGDDFIATGSIGGGALEHLALDIAKDFLKNRANENWQRLSKKISLGQDLRQSCGGTVELLFEFLTDFEKDFYQDILMKNKTGFIATPYESGKAIYGVRKIANEMDIYCQPIMAEIDKLYLFGAGHVGRAVAYHVSHLNFALHWIDFADSRFPENAEELSYEKWVAENPADKVQNCHKDSYFLIMSHSHALDYEIVDKILRRDDFRFLGLIGSRAKSLRFRKSLIKDGLKEEVVEKLTSPIGLLQTPDNTPHAIAVSVAAQLLKLQSESLKPSV